MKKVWIDTDMSGDDVAAICMLLASPDKIEVVGISTISDPGRKEIHLRLAKELLHDAGKEDTPIIPGVRDASEADDLAAQAFVDAIMIHPDEITPLILGPLTNIARALEIEPEIVSMVPEVVIMGGAVFCPGNITPVAEVNYYLDPPATRAVQYADWPIVLAPLDACDFSFLPPATQDKIYAGSKPFSAVLTRSLKAFHAFLRTVGHGESYYLPDGVAAAYLVNPEIFTRIEDLPIFIETAGACRGQSVPIISDRWSRQTEIAKDFELELIKRPTKVLLEMDEGKFLALVEDLLA